MKHACVIGWPIKHSRSPIIHNYWLKQHGLAGAYDKREIAPDGLNDFVAAIGREIAGCNVTVPHKEKALELVDDIDETARAVGAVNTIWADAKGVHGANTDVEGFLSNLDQAAPGWDRAPLKAVVLGAGGAARAVVFGLISRGAADIAIVNRSFERAEELMKDLGGKSRAAHFGELRALLPDATLLVNATSLGMQGKPPLEISLDGLNPKALVTDLVYVPLKTPLLESAEARGHKTVDGLGMLLHQAVPGFEKWFGVRPKVTPELRRLVEDDIARTS
ncbi:shikimate dehydrogenase (NADP(+)) [Terrihabitans soli]|uniref:Shikimate dehydrogenase (NADP(+)) n=1 Tax=Terrihabitans soli TaxID=708113 RepID=A0A6S6QK96_9HYPH|nr:shikimate dehydrogenase [Terrihabitans soli]BCJ89319.1 shikimate dehydrogenase (NADP(+)) [Terrihabitans soli]